MKKFTLVLAAMFSMAITASAQYTNKFWDNWSVGVEGGVTTNLHDWNTPHGAVAGVNITKGITPVYSLELSVGAGINNNYSWWMPKSANIVDNANVALSGKVNAMNLICGYKGEPRLFEVQARAGFGYMRYFNPAAESYYDVTGVHGHNDLNRAFAKLGVDFDFNLGEDKAWTVSVRPAVLLKVNTSANGSLNDAATDGYSHCGAYSHNAVGQVTAGVTYHFKNSTGKHYFTKVDPEIVEKVVEKVVDRPVEKIVEKIVEKEVIKDKSGVVVNFAQNKSNLTEAAKATLNTIAKGTSVKIDGYASPEGRKAYNQKLSEKRCAAVKEYLEGRGVKVADVNAHGAAGADSQRMVIVSLK